jgi:hypothetical protein
MIFEIYFYKTCFGVGVLTRFKNPLIWNERFSFLQDSSYRSEALAGRYGEKIHCGWS